MAMHRIVCVKTEHPHRHIVSVGTGENAGSPAHVYTVDEVRSMIKDGDWFHTVSPSTGALATVRRSECKMEGCTVRTIRSGGDAVTDNNLDNLGICP